MSPRTWLAAAALVSALAEPTHARAQEPRAPAIFDTTGTAWVYASYWRIPWPRVDSMVKLNRYLPAYRERAIQMGCFLDYSFLIHHTGNEYNVVTSVTYASFRSIGPGSGTGACTSRAWREVVPDSTLRAAIDRGNAYVYGDADHYDNIYWIPYPRRP